MTFLLVARFVVIGKMRGKVRGSSGVVVPALFVVVIVLIIYSIALPKTNTNVRFLLGPSFDGISKGMFLDTVNRTFFSLDLKVKYLYACTSCFDGRAGLAGATFDMKVVSAFITVLTKFVVFPTTFSMNVRPSSNPDLVFVALPGMFRRTFNKMPVLTCVFSIVFCTLLTVTTLASAVSLRRMMATCLRRRFGLSHKGTTELIAKKYVFLKVFYSLSLKIAGKFAVFNLKVFSLFSFIATGVVLPLNKLYVSLFAN